MRLLLYYFFKILVKTGLFFYTNRIKVTGKKNIPKKGAIVFLANHPNGLMDPIFIATNTKRKTFFLVQAAVFTNKLIANFFNLLGMMPVYRMKDGIKQLSKNEAIFNNCYNILNKQKALLLFPEGSHMNKRSIRPLSKGFTRIVFGALEKYPDLTIHIIPIGITYQNLSTYPCKIAINYGTPILANDYYDNNKLASSVKSIKEAVKNQLEQLSLHIPQENYAETLDKLNQSNVDFTEVTKLNTLLSLNKPFPIKKEAINIFKPLLLLIKLNSIIPYYIWKTISKKVNETEFIDTFRFSINTISFPIFYALQSYAFFLFTKSLVFSLSYFILSLVSVLLYSKLASTPTPK